MLAIGRTDFGAAGVAIDRVSEVSIGAFIGALLAMEGDADEIDALCFEEWIARRPLNDYTIPRHALIRGERFRSMLHWTFGSVRIEELPRAFTCSCTELRSGRLVTSRHGPLWEAVGFSMCLPIVAPPQVRGREIFTDRCTRWRSSAKVRSSPSTSSRRQTTQSTARLGGPTADRHGAQVLARR